MVLPAKLQQPFSVHLFEALPGDPKVPQGKAFAVLQLHDMGYIEDGERSTTSNAILVEYEKPTLTLDNYPRGWVLAWL